ncbi:Chromosome segregation in meiosis protein 3 [Aspergillus chevalieri]|uniref:Chromosome segregation in meiosis protein n=1 Tax=Aspergillus chevalieri TaxID=182096 RepID=A0A7R7VM71_ASPCH|nr:chromosome segregation in meiosis-related protein [Aspergillus chevalieri]BCR87037.1 chromosome segregation in meiosis-related protein [Aspergillus chevalieri]
MGSEGTQESQINDLFDYDVGLDDILRDVSTTSKTNAAKPPSGSEGPGLGLGLDEEVKVSKKRQPVAKLDESRLLSQNGIPKLRRTAKTKLRFKGKGHEFSDAARLLNFYQLWLDDLFPRAKFADGLSIIEKLGHSKRLQTMRREWIDEEKPKSSMDTFKDTLPERSQGNGQPFPNAHISESRANIEGLDGDDTNATMPQDKNRSDEELFMSDDEGGQHTLNESEPEDDDLDVLLKEQEDENPAPNKGSTIPEPSNEDTYEDDLEVLRELEAPGP